ncbi:hypothetical protein ANN_02827 [Periplaneta americana]|uniref:Uncharacterized protein n=1 Tax=Periplaneta americana TaxID=6978 RepID=A0ABQ8U1X9_PERAM|nr:hypothetical protein ANN_02827 [Periplaneta americana]
MAGLCEGGNERRQVSPAHTKLPLRSLRKKLAHVGATSLRSDSTTMSCIALERAAFERYGKEKEGESMRDSLESQNRIPV